MKLSPELNFESTKYTKSLSQWPRVLRRGSVAPRLLNCGFESSPEHGYLSLVHVSVVCCQVEVSATDGSLVRRNPTVCVCVCVCVCDPETSTMRRRKPDLGCCVTETIIIIITISSRARSELGGTR